MTTCKIDKAELDGGEAAYVSELAKTKLTKGRNNFAANFVGDIELDHAHVRRAERGVLFGSHSDAAEAPRLSIVVKIELVKEQGTLVAVTSQMHLRHRGRILPLVNHVIRSSVVQDTCMP